MKSEFDGLRGRYFPFTDQILSFRTALQVTLKVYGKQPPLPPAPNPIRKGFFDQERSEQDQFPTSHHSLLGIATAQAQQSTEALPTALRTNQ
ncbi:hypothetical protein HYALB_00012550 [Hymenoscyphus albidus]|uniref:Uncharacterized protein n=1 Tax=Hymenoscyphus albidus TaxID=595503 RepID=A0A9N9Q9I0_9HELO|nr:hypothetical protein HYALB_00012550 [Hymenoscyphus albidus]